MIRVGFFLQKFPWTITAQTRYANLGNNSFLVFCVPNCFVAHLYSRDRPLPNPVSGSTLLRKMASSCSQDAL